MQQAIEDRGGEDLIARSAAHSETRLFEVTIVDERV